MKKFLALGVLATFFLAPTVQAQDWHRTKARHSYRNHRQHRPVRGHYNYQQLGQHRRANWGHRNYYQTRQHRQMTWRNRYYRGNRNYHRMRQHRPVRWGNRNYYRARQYRQSQWGHNNHYQRWGQNNYARRWDNQGARSRQGSWEYSQTNGRGSYQPRTQQFSDSDLEQ
jgi:hypothetical protein